MKNYTRVFFFSALYTYYLAFFKTYKSSRKTVLGYGFDCLTILSKTESDWNFIMFQNGLTGTFIVGGFADVKLKTKYSDSIIGALAKSDSGPFSK